MISRASAKFQNVHGRINPDDSNPKFQTETFGSLVMGDLELAWNLAFRMGM
jgi:hypothetical protein